MAIGYLQINVFADNVGQPVEMANIEITGKDTKVKITTDSSRKNR